MIDNSLLDKDLFGVGSDRTLAESTLLEDFIKFKSEKTNETRAKLGKQLCEQFIYDTFKPAEQQIVKEILRLLINDIDIGIRREIAENLKLSPSLPHDIAFKLANDVIDVSEPILLFSPVLTEPDLVSIVESANDVEKWASIAKRIDLTDNVATSIIKTGCDIATEYLVVNPCAKLSDANAWKIVNNYTNQSVFEALVNKGNLTKEIAEKIISLVPYEFQEKLRLDCNVSSEMARKSNQKTRESLVINSVSPLQSKQKSSKFVEHLFDSGRLTQSILIKALTQAEYYIFAYGIAKLSGIPEHNAEALMLPEEKAGFEAIYLASSFPPSLLDAVRALKDIVYNNLDTLINLSKEMRSKHIAELIMAEKLEEKIPKMQYLLTLIRNN